MKKSRYITDEIEQEIVERIDLLVVRGEKVTWKRIEEVAGYTRAALTKKEKIQTAYDAATAESKTIKTDAEKISELTEEVEKLKKKSARNDKIIEDYDNKYVRWIYNASAVGISEEQLNRSLPKTMKTTKREKGLS